MTSTGLRPTLFALAVVLAVAGAPSAASAASFALLINGDPSFAHAQNVEIATAALVSLGYPRENILFAADMKEVRAAVRELERRLSAADALLLYTTGHGARNGSESRLYLKSGLLGAGELSRMVFALKFRRLIYVGDQCYSGGFATAFGSTARNVVAVTATDDTHQARCEPFVRPFWRAAVEQGVTVEAAYEVASRRVKAALGGSPESATRYVATGEAVGHGNAFGG